jgi:hypothetical protein
MKNSILIIVVLVAHRSFGQQFTDLCGDYLEQTPPGDTPVIFAPGFISGNSIEHSATAFSPHGNEVYGASHNNQSALINLSYLTWKYERKLTSMSN